MTKKITMEYINKIIDETIEDKQYTQIAMIEVMTKIINTVVKEANTRIEELEKEDARRNFEFTREL